MARCTNDRVDQVFCLIPVSADCDALRLLKGAGEAGLRCFISTGGLVYRAHNIPMGIYNALFEANTPPVIYVVIRSNEGEQ